MEQHQSKVKDQITETDTLLPLELTKEIIEIH